MYIRFAHDVELSNCVTVLQELSTDFNLTLTLKKVVR